MPDVVMEDGTIIKDVPEGTTQSELLRKFEAMDGPARSGRLGAMSQIATEQDAQRPPEVQEDPRGALSAVAEFGLRGVADNIMAAPSATGTLLADGVALMRTAGDAVGKLFTGEDITFRDTFEATREDERNKFPANALREIPAPTSIDLQSASKTATDLLAHTLATPIEDNTFAGFMEQQDRLALPEAPLMSFEQRRDFELEGMLDRREAQPNASLAGDVFGDVATVLTGRTPMVLSRRNRAATADQAEDIVSRDALGNRLQRGHGEVEIPPAGTEGYFQMVKSRFQNPIRSTQNVGRNISETGLEGAYLAAVNDQDPATAFGLAAGSQAMGSGFRGAASGVWKNLALASAGTLAVIQTFKEATPGGRDRILESSEESFEKMALAMGLAAVATTAGFGRASNRTMNTTGLAPAFADASHTLRRVPTLTLLNSLQNDHDQLLETYFAAVKDNADQFDDVVNRRMQRSLEGNGPDPLETLKLLQSDRKFRRQMIELKEGNGK